MMAITRMLVLPDTIKIFNVVKDKSVLATLGRLTRDVATTIDGTWWSISVSRSQRQEEGDHHWKWRKLIGKRRHQIAWDAMAVISAGGGVEGAMLFRVDAKSQLDRGKGAVYVDRLSTSPRNRPWLADPPKYRGIGSVLVLAAVRTGYSLGLGGRVWLTSLPSEKTRAFYENRGFKMIFENDDGTIDYELPVSDAERWLKNEGYLR
jgi:GNAT superfamily N-acetyltransferase